MHVRMRSVEAVNLCGWGTKLYKEGGREIPVFW